jgi:UDP-sugar transporter A1/2/3
MTSRSGGSSALEKTIAIDPEEGKSLLLASGGDSFESKDTATGKSGKKSKRKVKRVRKKTVDHSPLIKYGSLVLLVAQLVGLVMLMRFSRTHSNGKDLYLSSTAVFLMEVMKYITCNVVVFMQCNYNMRLFMSEMYHHVKESPIEMLKVSVPSFLYVIQNNLLYLALSNLDAATYQVCYQMKILTTALFSATMLKRKFSPTKWFSLVLLTIGVAIVQTSGDTAGNATEDEETQNRGLGLFAILCAACTSGFSGVYFEKILKGSTTSLWIRNIQMGIPSMILSFLTILIQDGDTVAKKGFFVGYSPTVWTVIVVQAVGGLIVAVVVKYADNVLKTFASSFGIVVSCIVSAILRFSSQFGLCGWFNVCSYEYGTLFEAREKTKEETEEEDCWSSCYCEGCHLIMSMQIFYFLHALWFHGVVL